MGLFEKAKILLMGFRDRTKRLLDSMTSLLLQKRDTVLLVVVVVLLTLLTSSLVSIWLSRVSDLHFPSIGTIRISGLKAYWDPTLTNETKEVLWGHLFPGSVSSITLYLQSISSTPITLEMTATNWTLSNSLNDIVYGPAGSIDHLELSWNYSGSTIGLHQVIPVVFTLRVDYATDLIEYVIENDVRQFTFEINIRALEENTR